MPRLHLWGLFLGCCKGGGCCHSWIFGWCFGCCKGGAALGKHKGGGQDGPKILEMVGCHWVLWLGVPLLSAMPRGHFWCRCLVPCLPCYVIMLYFSVKKQTYFMLLGSMLKGFLPVMFLICPAIIVCSILWVSNAEHAQQNAQQNTSGHSPLTQRRNHVCRAIYKCRKSHSANQKRGTKSRGEMFHDSYFFYAMYMIGWPIVSNFFLFEIVFHDILKSIVFEMPCWARLRSVAT